MKHFNYSEFNCKCRTCQRNGETRGEDHMDEDFLQMLDRARELSGIPFVVNSGLRCVAHNKTSGGKRNSAHLTGCAADIHCIDERARCYIVGALLESGINRVGIAPTFIHADNSYDPEHSEDVIWLYN